jgi:protein-tyrosine phosphatase
MAEVLLKEKVRQSGYADRINVQSAGLYAMDGFVASSHAQTTMAKRGLDLTVHRSRRLLPQYVQNADLILTMTKAHKLALAEAVPLPAGKAYSLAEYAGESGDVLDPVGGSEADYEQCAELIERLLDKVWQKIEDLAGKNERM